MKFASKWLIIATAALAILTGACTKKKEISSDKDRYSYAIGYQFAKNLKTQDVDVDTAALALAVEDVIAGKDPRVSEEDMQKAMQAMYEERQEKMIKDASENKEKGKNFLEENKDKEGVKTTDSGLQYRVVEAGSGASPKSSDTVVVHYRGTLIDGSEFDSSYSRNTPAEFPVGAVIPGWTEALQLMKKGAKYELFIPSELAYGERGRPGIPPNSVLIFEVELLEIKN